ncbi:MAG: 23S rRNA (uracil(1939)-C(5))-methyltransferase RlmD, partial [Lachnospiraceae bacterium]|nr:23S rRNA (uracil(1939)-C(5))-methyltransferase RlmD [Lachnospiraceae bacterium]
MAVKKGMEYIGTVERTDFPNKGIVMIDGEKVSVKNALPGQKIRFTIGKVRNGRAEGNLKEVLERSPIETIAPLCPHFGQCGGCAYQGIAYHDQLELKSAQVKRMLDNAAAGDYEFLGITPSPSERAYRNKMEFSFGDSCKYGELTLGLHKKGSFYDILQITDCAIVDDDYNEIIKCVIGLAREFGLTYTHKITHRGYLRHLLIRRATMTGEILVNLITTSQWTDGVITEPEFMGKLRDRLLALNLNGSIVGILHSTNDDNADAVKAERTDILYGKDFLIEELLGLFFRISTFSFFQTNSRGAEVLYNTARDFIGDIGNKVIFDLYSGTGTIAQVLAPVAKKVIGVEIVQEAVDSARDNTNFNNISNCEFICGDVLKVLDTIEDKPDLIVLDPPREGIHPKALDKIIAYGVDRIVYISCNPVSLARDLGPLQEGGYRLEKAKCVDMFPQTNHCETVALLSKLSEAKHFVNVKVEMDELDV